MSGQPTSWSWDDYRIVDEVPSPSHYLLLPVGMPLGALLSWYAGPSHVVRCAALAQRDDTRHEVEHADGTLRRWTQLWTDDDETFLDDGWDQDLAALGVAPRPRGTDWYLHVPGDTEIMHLFAATEQEMPWPMSAEAYVRFLTRTGEIVRERYDPIPDVLERTPKASP